MRKHRFASVWDVIEESPPQVSTMGLRAALMMALKNHIVRADMSRLQAAELLGLTRQRVSDLTRGKINRFDLDALVNMVAVAGLHFRLRTRSCVAQQLEAADASDRP
jgi:predicted XRE-type DNA-binding protein